MELVGGAASLLCLAAIVVGPLRLGLALVVAVQVLVPSTYVVPNGFSPLVTLGRASLVAALLSLLWRTARGRVAAGTFSATPVHLAMLGFLAVAVVAGMAMAAPDIPVVVQREFFARYVDHLAAFAVALGYLRALRDPRYVLWVLVGATVTMAGIGVVEHVTEASYGRALLRRIDPTNFTLAANQLEVRSGQVRVRGASSFTIQYAWVMAMLIPAVWAALLAVRARLVPLVVAALGLSGGALVWSYSRSALVGIVLSTAVAALVLRLDRRILLTLGASALLVLAAASLTHADDPFVDRSNEGTVEVRRERIPIAAGLVADQPHRGLGLGALEVRNLPATDNTFLLTYAELGAIGVAALVLVLVVAALCTLPGILAPPGPDRWLAAAACAALAGGVLGGAAFDLLANPQSAIVMFLMAGFGVGVAERVRPPVDALRRPTVWRVACFGGLVATGFLVAAVVPSEGTVTTRYAVTTDAGYVNSPFSIFVQQIFVNTACGVVQATDDADASIEARCDLVQEQSGVIEVRVEADDLAAARAGAEEITTAMDAAVPDLSAFVVASDGDARPAAGTTAPYWMTVLGLAAALLLAPLRPRELARRANRLVLGTT